MIDTCLEELAAPNSVHVELLSCVSDLCEWQYEAASLPGDKGMDYLNLRDLHKVIVTHPNYEQLMIHSKLDTHGYLKGELNKKIDILMLKGNKN